jgi:hypothetical protein
MSTGQLGQNRMVNPGPLEIQILAQSISKVRICMLLFPSHVAINSKNPRQSLNRVTRIMIKVMVPSIIS